MYPKPKLMPIQHKASCAVTHLIIILGTWQENSPNGFFIWTRSAARMFNGQTNQLPQCPFLRLIDVPQLLNGTIHLGNRTPTLWQNIVTDKHYNNKFKRSTSTFSLLPKKIVKKQTNINYSGVGNFQIPLGTSPNQKLSHILTTKFWRILSHQIEMEPTEQNMPSET